MIPVRAEEIRLELGRLERGTNGDVITGIKADSREVGPGDLFVALNTGIRYVDEARPGAATPRADDQEAALVALASLKALASVVMVVGSAGKTTTKDVLGALCATHVSTIWAEKSLNNEIGLPLTVCRLEPETEVLVTEMGMRGLGQIAALCAIAPGDRGRDPHRRRASRASRNRRAGGRGEREAIATLPAAPPSSRLERRRSSPISVGTTSRFGGSIRGRRTQNGTTRFALDGLIVELDLPFTQRHHAVNALAALHAYAALGLLLERAATGAGAIQLSLARTGGAASRRRAR